MGLKKLIKKLGLRKLKIKFPFVEAELDIDMQIDNGKLQLSIIEASVAYTLYSVSLVNYTIALKEGKDTRIYQLETKNRGATLKAELKRCGLKLSIPDSFKSADEAMSYLTKSPILVEASDLFQNKYSQFEADFFGFCTIIGAIVVAQDSPAEPIKQAKVAGKVVGLPLEIIEECITQPGFRALRQHVRNSYKRGGKGSKGVKSAVDLTTG